MIYICKKCDKRYYNKTDFTRHLERKNPCDGNRYVRKTKSNNVCNTTESENVESITVSDNYELRKSLDNKSQYRNREKCIGQEYQCNVCLNTFSTKSNATRHYNKYCKKKTNLTELGVKPYVVPYTEPLNRNNRENSGLAPKSTDSRPKTPSTDLKMGLKYDLRVQCEYCDKTFVKRYGLVRHLNGRCKVKKQMDSSMQAKYEELLKDYNRQKEELQSLKGGPVSNNVVNNTTNNNNNCNNTNNTVNNTTNNNTTNNTNNVKIENVNLVAFGKENLDLVSDEVIKKMIKKGFMAVNSFIEYVHFNKNKPQFQNVYIPNIKEPYAMVYDDELWALKDRAEVVNMLYDDKKCHLEIKYEEFVATLDPVAKKKFNRFLETIEEDPGVEEKVKKDIRLMLYNNRALIKENKKKSKMKLLENKSNAGTDHTTAQS